MATCSKGMHAVHPCSNFGSTGLGFRPNFHGQTQAQQLHSTIGLRLCVALVGSYYEATNANISKDIKLHEFSNSKIITLFLRGSYVHPAYSLL